MTPQDRRSIGTSFSTVGSAATQHTEHGYLRTLVKGMPDRVAGRPRADRFCFLTWTLEEENGLVRCGEMARPAGFEPAASWFVA